MLKSAKEGFLLPVKPITPDDNVFTHYWVYNFDVTVDRINGGGSVNTIHLVAYQERGSDHSVNDVHLPVSVSFLLKIYCSENQTHRKQD